MQYLVVGSRCCACYQFGVWAIHGQDMGKIWAIQGRDMGDTGAIHGQDMGKIWARYVARVR